MKNIFIGGTAKSGKSRLAEYLHDELGYNHIPVDYFTSSFKHNFKELGITSNPVINKETSELLSKFLSRVIEIMDMSDDECFILDSAHVLPCDIIKFLNKDKWDIYFLGYPNVTAEDKLEELNRFHKNGWTIKRTHEENIEILNKLIEISKEIEKQCNELGVKYIDTSNGDILEIINKEETWNYTKENILK